MSLPFLPINKHYFLFVFPFLPILQPQKAGRGWKQKRNKTKSLLPPASGQQGALVPQAVSQPSCSTSSGLYNCYEPGAMRLSLLGTRSCLDVAEQRENGRDLPARQCAHPPRRKRKCRWPASKKGLFLEWRWRPLLCSPRCPRCLHSLRAYSII